MKIKIQLKLTRKVLKNNRILQKMNKKKLIY